MTNIRFNVAGSGMDLRLRAASAAAVAVFCLSSAIQAAPDPGGTADPNVPFPVIESFQNFGKAEGMPSTKIHGVMRTSDGKLWVGTWNGLLTRDGEGPFRRIGTEDGLSHKMVLSMAEDPASGDLWVGTMRGLNRYSAGRITTYTQTSSGLPNNVVYGVDVAGDTVWAATAAGTGVMNLKTGVWRIFDHNNTLMHEPWCYTVKAAGPKMVYIGVWGAGILEHDVQKGTFKEYRDPDRDFHYDLVPNDGPINDITSWLAWEDGVLWQTTYFGVSRYDGKSWLTWVEDKSPLLSNFTQFVYSHHGVAYIGTDRGVSVTDSKNWVNYTVGENGAGVVEIHRPDQPVEKRGMKTALANGFVLGIYVDDREAWFATSKGLSRGVFRATGKTSTVAGAQ